jgi:hypothetical protein
MSKKIHKESHTALAVIGGLAAAAAAGVYFIYGNKEVQKKAKKVKGWALKAKGEVLEKIEKIKAIDEKAYHDAIDAVMKKYEKIKSIDTTEAMSVARELKSHWRNIKKELQGTTTKVAKVVTKVAKDAKKAVK